MATTVKAAETRISFSMDYTGESQYAKHPSGQWYRRDKKKTPWGYRLGAWRKSDEPRMSLDGDFGDAHLPADVDAPKVPRVRKASPWQVGAPVFVYVDGKPILQARVTDVSKSFVGTSFATGLIMFLDGKKTTARSGTVEVRLMG